MNSLDEQTLYRLSGCESATADLGQDVKDKIIAIETALQPMYEACGGNSVVTTPFHPFDREIAGKRVPAPTGTVLSVAESPTDHHPGEKRMRSPQGDQGMPAGKKTRVYG
jgi:hypothetical protein